MPWNLILNWRVIVAALFSLILTTTHWKMYVLGKHSATAAIQAQTLANEQAARLREQTLTAAKQKAEEDHAAFKLRTQRSVASAQSELGRLRDVLNARQASTTSTPSTGSDAATTTERQLFGQCAQTLAGMASEADGLAAKLSGLQGYVKGVCLAPE
jgi:DNA anti-recombination protein RmuC